MLLTQHNLLPISLFKAQGYDLWVFLFPQLNNNVTEGSCCVLFLILESNYLKLQSLPFWLSSDCNPGLGFLISKKEDHGR